MTTKRMFFIATLICSFFYSHDLKAQETDFSGTWIRNSEKCDPGGLSLNSIPVSIMIIQGKSQIKITRNSKNRSGDSSSYTELLKFDSSRSTSVVKSNLNKKSKIAWSADQKEIIGTADYTDDSGTLLQKANDSWKLLDNGMTLQIKLRLEFDLESHDLVEIFDRK